MVGAQTAYMNSTPWAEAPPSGFGNNPYSTGGKPRNRAQTSYGTPSMRQRYGSSGINPGAQLIGQ